MRKEKVTNPKILRLRLKKLDFVDTSFQDDESSASAGYLHGPDPGEHRGYPALFHLDVERVLCEYSGGTGRCRPDRRPLQDGGWCSE